MFPVFFITLALLWCHVADSYILLTANIEDFQAIAKQIAASPVGAQINQIFNRASSIFKDVVNPGPHQRSDSKKDQELQGNSFEVWKPDALEKAKEAPSAELDSLSEKDEAYLKDRAENMVERRAGIDAINDFAAIGNNASYYLQSIKKIFDKV